MGRLLLLVLLTVGLMACRRSPEAIRRLPQRSFGLEPLPVADDSLDAAVDQARRVFVPLGSTPFFTSAPGELAPWKSWEGELQVAPPLCHQFLAVAREPGQMLELALEDERGTDVARDQSAMVAMVPSYCPAEPQTLQMRLASPEGRGDVALAVYTLPAADFEPARRLGELALGRLPRGRALGPVHAVPLYDGATVDVPIALSAGACIAVLVVADEGLEELDLELRDPWGEPLVRDLGVDSEPVIERYCSAAGEVARLVFLPYRGAGTAWWQLFGLPPE